MTAASATLTKLGVVDTPDLLRPPPAVTTGSVTGADTTG